MGAMWDGQDAPTVPTLPKVTASLCGPAGCPNWCPPRAARTPTDDTEPPQGAEVRRWWWQRRDPWEPGRHAAPPPPEPTYVPLGELTGWDGDR